MTLVFHNRGPGSVARVDRTKMEQVLDNLITNAIKFSPAGAQVTIRLYQDDGAAVIAVCDEGPGIPAQEREKLFRPFYRAGTQDTGDAEHRLGPGHRASDRRSARRSRLDGERDQQGIDLLRVRAQCGR